MIKSVSYYNSPIGSLEIVTFDFEVHGCRFLEDMNTGTFAASPFGKIVIDQLDEYFTGKRKSFQLTLGDVGTKFDDLVWDEVCRIKYGTTQSYQQVADKINAPDSVRAVGASNGRNPILIIVPCHRVVAIDGSLKGYAGQLWRKKWLLEHEAKVEWGVQTLFT